MQRRAGQGDRGGLCYGDIADLDLHRQVVALDGVELHGLAGFGGFAGGGHLLGEGARGERGDGQGGGGTKGFSDVGGGHKELLKVARAGRAGRLDQVERSRWGSFERSAEPFQWVTGGSSGNFSG